MRVLVLALAVALVAANQERNSPGFAQGKTYVYQYVGEVMGGLPEQGLARAGVKIQSRVLIRAIADNKILLKLENLTLFEYSGIWPKDSFIPATNLTTDLAAQLLAPVKFEYRNGVVGKVYATAGVNENVLNTYRGIISILQMNLKKTQNVYDLQEIGAQGVCKTQYTITDDQKADRIYITKTKDLNQCQEQIVKDIGLSYTEKCIACEDKAKALRGASSFSYVLKPEDTGARILQATVTELIQFSPFNILNGAPHMQSKQNLTFVEQNNIQLECSRNEYVPRGSLQYEFSSEHLQTPFHILKRRDLPMGEILDNLVTSNRGKVQEKAPLEYIQLIQLLREARYENIEQLWNQKKDRPEHRHWLLNAIPSIRTHAALRFIKEKHLANELTIPEAVHTLMMSVHLVKANPEAIRMARDMVLDRKFHEAPLLRQAVMLGYGSLIGKHCVENKACSPELVKPVHDLLIQAVERGEPEEIIALLKVLGNAGHPASRKPIQKLLPPFCNAAAALPHRVHIEAVLALRNIARMDPKMVQEIAVELFMDRALHKELRMVAAMVLFDTKLPMGLVMTVADAVLKEKNLQIASFVYSYMKSMTKTIAPDQASLAAACNVAIRILSPRLNRLSYRYSRSLYADAYDYSWMAGAAVSAHYINEAATILPKTVMAKVRTYLAGMHADIIEVGVRTEGIQEAIQKSTAQDDSREQLRINKMRTIIRALNQWRAQPSRQPLASLYVKFFGQEIAFANIDKELVEKLIQLSKQYMSQCSGKNIMDALESGFNMFYAQPMMLAEIRRILPTAVGLPMELGLYTAAVASASVEVQATVTPRPADDFQVAQLLKSDINVRAAIVPSVSAHTYAVMGINTDLLKAVLMSRAKVHTVVPAKMEIRVDMAKGNFKLQLPPIQGINKIVSAEHEILAVARSLEDAARITPLIPAEQAAQMSRQQHNSQMASSLFGDLSASSQPLHPGYEERRDIQLPRNLVKRRCSESETFGIKLCSETQVRNASYINAAPLYAMFGKHVAEVTVAPAAGPAFEKIDIEVQIGERSAEKILKVINLSEEEDTTESRNVLLKLKKILAPTQRNGNSSSSSSSSSQSDSSGSSSSSSLSSSSSYQSARNSRRQDIDQRTDNQQGPRRNSVSSSSQSSQQSSSSSSSSQQNSVARDKLYAMKFVKNHVHQHALSAGRGNSGSSGQSFENIYKKAKYLARSVAPSVTILIRGVRADQKILGYQFAAYADNTTARLQFIIANLAEDNHYRICADGIILSNHKLMAKIGWGIECKQHWAEITAETGLIDQKLAASLKMSWSKLTRRMQRSIKRLSKYISHMAERAGLNIAKIKNIQNQIKLTLTAVSNTSINVVLQTPKGAIYKLGVGLPVTLPIGNSVPNTEGEWQDRISQMLLETNAAECQVVQDTVSTFNHKKFSNSPPHKCQQVLAQDCTDALKYMVLLRKDNTNNQNEVTVEFGTLAIKLYMKDNAAAVRVDGHEVELRAWATHEPKEGIKITRSGSSILVTAPTLGLLKVIYDAETVKVQVPELMRGKTCGLCGNANGENRQGYRGANNRQHDDPNSFAHSWVLGGESCRDASECLMRLESVKLEKQVNVYGQDSKCYSVDPVLRCLPGCIPVRTTTVNVGYHCVPADSYMNIQAGQSNIHEKSVDLREDAEAHVACRCTAQCA